MLAGLPGTLLVWPLATYLMFRNRVGSKLTRCGIPLRLYVGGFPRWVGETSARVAHTGRYVAREDDLVEQATRLLSERGLTARLGDAATRRAHQDHTYDLRVTAILEKLS